MRAGSRRAAAFAVPARAGFAGRPPRGAGITQFARLFSTQTEKVAAIVDSSWLRANIDNVKIVDGSWSLNKPKEPHRVQIPGAVYFDIDDICDKSTWLPHMLPSAKEFAAKMTQLGIQNDDHIVLYDHSNGQFVASARIWWTFRVFGHHRVSVLEGGFADWPEGVEIPRRNEPKKPYATPKKDFSLVWDKSQVLENIESHAPVQLVDARSEARFYALADEPRPDIPRGSIPHSFNLPYTEVFRTEKRRTKDGKECDVYLLKDEKQLNELLERKSLALEGPIATSCGSGVTASVLALAFYRLGKRDVPVYDGSWTQWSTLENVPRVALRRKPQNVF